MSSRAYLALRLPGPIPGSWDYRIPRVGFAHAVKHDVRPSKNALICRRPGGGAAPARKRPACRRSVVRDLRAAPGRLESAFWGALRAGLPLLLGRADQHLIHRDVPRPGHDVDDRVGDVLGLHRLPELVSYAVEHLGPVVAG
jgi:hypothetical protein